MIKIVCLVVKIHGLNQTEVDGETTTMNKFNNKIRSLTRIMSLVVPGSAQEQIEFENMFANNECINIQ